MMHLVYIKKKNLLTKLHIIHTCKKCQLAVLFNCIEHEIYKINSSSFKKLFARKTLLISSIVIN